MPGELRPMPVFMGTAIGVLGLLAVLSGLSKPVVETETLAAAAIPEKDFDTRLASAKSLSITELAGTGWQSACLSRGAQPVPAGMEGCWPSAGETGLGGSFLNVIDASGQCRQWRTINRVIDKRFDDVVCLPSQEVPDLTLVLKAKVLDIE